MKFVDFNLHKNLIDGLNSCGYYEPTKIQELVIPVAMNGESIIASSKTGSGKTISFVVPVLFQLKKLKWNREDGLGALIIVPTRELAIQIYETFCKVGKYHPFSIGVIIGGIMYKKNGCEGQLNIIIATPGRLLDLFETSYTMNCTNLISFVLDEADKMLQMGFKEDLIKIIEYLGSERQNLLFTATPNYIMKNLDCLDIDFKKCKIISDVTFLTTLKQLYFTIESIEYKLDYLYHALVLNRKRKIIVFFSTCKEVKFFFYLFRKLLQRSNINLFMLYGKMKQNNRLQNYEDFQVSISGVLFCTDLGSRGLDFNNIDIVIQYDCPESVETYFHRIGRTARNGKIGTSVLYLIKQEQKILKYIEKGKVLKIGKKEKENQTQITILQKKNKPKRSILKEVKGIIQENPEMEVWFEKYLKSYERYLKLTSAKYLKESIPEINESLENFRNDYIGFTKDATTTTKHQ